jgi:alkanesulfonate monooxygenase SsuD/methylene tetrahydromethanopterin reductase-like flavin-dependent oxidoreductase (luciferase family)
MRYALTYHIEGPRSQPSLEIYQEIAEQVRLADALGFHYAWFAEHHAHIHLGHLPCPLLFALHLAGLTEGIHLGTAVICLNMHHPVEVAEQVAVADLLTCGRISPGFGSGSTVEELALFGLPHVDADTRHAAFDQALRVIRDVWAGRGPTASAPGTGFGPPLPLARADLCARSWVAANSPEAARIAGAGGHHLMLSFLRTPEQYSRLLAEYRSAGGLGAVAANRPTYLATTDEQAWREAEPALRILWRRFVAEGKIPAGRPEPERFTLENAPGQFVVGCPDTVAAHFAELWHAAPYQVLNIEPRWAGLPPSMVHTSLRLFAGELMPRLEAALPPEGHAWPTTSKNTS